MAVTKIIPVKVNVKACINYVTNKDKTEEQTLVYSHGCPANDAAANFYERANSKNTKCRKDQDPNLAYHFIQSFSPEDNITPEKAFELGQEYIKNLLGNEYYFVMATHVDKNHIHNHFCVCASKMDMSGRKMENNRTMIHKMQNESDKICRAAGLSVIEEKKGKGKHYKEWQEDKINPKGSHRTELKNDIDSSIRESASYEEFLERMKEKGYRIETGNTKKTECGKYNAFIKEDWIAENPKARPLRDFTLDGKKGASRYTIDKIEERIKKRVEWLEQKAQERAERKASMTVQERKEAYHTLRGNSMHNQSGVEVTNDNRGTLKWQQNQNRLLFTKIMQEAQDKYSLSFTEFESRLEDIKEAKKDITAEQARVESYIESLQKGISYAEVYRANATINNHFQNAQNKESYFQEHESRLLAFDEADRQLFLLGVDGTQVDAKFIENMKAKLGSMKEQASEIKEKLSSLNDEEADLVKWQSEMNIYLGKAERQEQAESAKEQERKKRESEHEAGK